MRGRILVLGLSVLSGAGACSDGREEQTRGSRHSERDASAADVRVSERDAAPDVVDTKADAEPDGGAQCCPISPAPSCCMEYGGSRLIRGFCGVTCDGMPWPSPLWSIQLDEYGCPYWVEPGNTEGCCGCVYPEAGD
jgi:hypothetical protein